MASAEAERQPGVQEGRTRTAGSPQPVATTGGHVQSSECPVTGDQCLVPANAACGTQGEDKCPTGPVSEPGLQEGRLQLEEERFKAEVEAPEERGPRPVASIVRPSHGPKRKPVNLAGPSHQAPPRTEAEAPPGLPLQREESEGSHSEPSPSSKQHKKAKKRKNPGNPVLPAVASTASAPSETLGLERKAQRLRPLYQYINYCNPELNQAGEGDREAEVDVEAEAELALAPEEAAVEQLQVLLPITGDSIHLPTSGVAPVTGYRARFLAEDLVKRQPDGDHSGNPAASDPPVSPQHLKPRAFQVKRLSSLQVLFLLYFAFATIPAHG